MFQDTTYLAAMAETLNKSGDYRVLRRLVPRLPSTRSSGQDTRTTVLLDTETSGLDARADEIIELGMVKFDCLHDGRVADVRGTFSAFNEPSVPIPTEITSLTGITALTGITDDMVAGRRIGEAAVTAFVNDAAIIDHTIVASS